MKPDFEPARAIPGAPDEAPAPAGPNSRCWCGGELGQAVHPLYGQCRLCGTLVLRRPFTPAELKSQYSLIGYWYLQQTQKEHHPDIQERSVRDFDDRIPVWHRTLTQFHPNPRRVLEIGCAHGGFLHYCEQRGVPEIVGIEVDEATCRFARERFGLEHVCAGLFPDVELPFDSFDAICGFDVLEHFCDPAAAVRAIGRLLAPGGAFFFQTPCYRGEGNGWTQFRPGEHLFLFNEASIRQLFASCGLRIDRVLPGCFADDMFVLGAHAVAPATRAPANRPRVAAELSAGKDWTAIQDGSRFESSLRELIQRIRPRFVVETGTYLGKGTTRIIGSALKDLGFDQAIFYSIECNPDHHRQAAANLRQAGLSAYVRLLHGLSVPRNLLPSPETIRRQTIEQAAGSSVIVDHPEAQRVELYHRETDFPEVPDDLLGACLRECGGRPDLVLLDSGGHVGHVEFNYLISQLRGPCYIALDDVLHIKHARSLQQINSDPRFEVLVESDEKFGFCIARFVPAAIQGGQAGPAPAVPSPGGDVAAARRCWCGAPWEPAAHPLYGRCARCGTLGLRRRLDPSELKTFYSFDAYWHDHQTQNLKCPPIEERAETDLQDRIPAWHQLLVRLRPEVRTLLEIGCAHGGFLHYCRERGVQTVVGSEVDEATCRFARERFGLPHVYGGLFPEVQLPFGHFDAVTGFDVLEHLDDPLRALKRVAQLLDDDGVFLFQVPCYRGQSQEWRMFCPTDHVYLCTEEGWRRLFQEAGLEVEEILPGLCADDVFVTGRKQGEVRRLLWVRTDSIGDGVLASSMLPHLRRRFPGAQTAVLCQEQLVDLYLNCPALNRIICFDRRQLASDPAYKQSLLRELDEFAPDLVLNSTYSPDALSEELTHANHAARKLGIAAEAANISGEELARWAAQYSRLIPSPGARKPELERHRDFLAGLGIAVDQLQPAAWTSREDEEVAGRFFAQNALDSARTVAVFPGAQSELRVYPYFAAALEEFQTMQFLIVSGAESEALGQRLAQQLPGRALNLAGKTRLGQLAALLRRCRLFVGTESAGAHLACAVGVPNVVVTGGGHFGRFVPNSPLTTVVCLPLECFHCDWRCKHSRAYCVKDLSPQVLAEAVRQALRGSAAKPRLFAQTSSVSAPLDTLPASFRALAQEEHWEIVPVPVVSEPPPAAGANGQPAGALAGVAPQGARPASSDEKLVCLWPLGQAGGPGIGTAPAPAWSHWRAAFGTLRSQGKRFAGLRLGMVVMRGNFREIPRFLDFAEEHQVAASLWRIQGSCADQNIFAPPDRAALADLREVLAEELNRQRAIAVDWSDLLDLADAVPRVASSPDDFILEAGFYECEGNFRWMDRRAWLVAPNRPAGSDSRVAFDLICASLHCYQGASISARVFCDDTEVACLEFASDEQSIPCVVPLSANGRTRIRIESSAAFVPAQLGPNPDQRRLAVRLSNLRYVPPNNP